MKIEVIDNHNNKYIYEANDQAEIETWVSDLFDALSIINQEAKPLLPYSKPKTYRSKAYLDFIRKQPCIFGHGAGEPHHVGLGGRRGTSIKAPDSHCVSLCRSCHDKVEKLFIDRLSIIENIMIFIEEQDRSVNALMLVIDFLTNYMQEKQI